MIVITGASGFLGMAIALSLHRDGIPIRCVYRRPVPPSNLSALEGADCQLVQGDMSMPEVAESVLEGTEAVIHAAARASDWGDAEAFHRDNVVITRRVAEAAVSCGVRRMVHVSSLAVMGFGPHDEKSEDGARYSYVNLYQSSKAAAEEVICEVTGEGRLETVVIRPGNIYGPGDTTTWYPLLRVIRHGLMPLVDRGRSLTCPVYIDDVVKAIRLALIAPQAVGETFSITGGERINWHEQFKYAAIFLGRRARFLNFPSRPLRRIARTMETTYRVLGISRVPPLTVYRVDQLRNDYHFSISRARNLLGYCPEVPFDEGIRRTVEAFLHDSDS
jgi:nucleoside-diphosphate-sugar epimerase